jgi:hypothetical protein
LQQFLTDFFWIVSSSHPVHFDSATAFRPVFLNREFAFTGRVLIMNHFCFTFGWKLNSAVGFLLASACLSVVIYAVI